LAARRRRGEAAARLERIPAECVHKPATAICVIESLRPTLLVLDPMVPGLTGTDLLEAIRGIPTLASIPGDLLRRHRRRQRRGPQFPHQLAPVLVGQADVPDDRVAPTPARSGTTGCEG
jgi:CheY-like chemotaxis protein